MVSTHILRIVFPFLSTRSMHLQEYKIMSHTTNRWHSYTRLVAAENMWCKTCDSTKLFGSLFRVLSVVRNITAAQIFFRHAVKRKKELRKSKSPHPFYCTRAFSFSKLLIRPQNVMLFFISFHFFCDFTTASRFFKALVRCHVQQVLNNLCTVYYCLICVNNVTWTRR